MDDSKGEVVGRSPARKVVMVALIGKPARGSRRGAALLAPTKVW
jgi:hypothetical protein